ncbi:MAG: alpha/beta fold hydrolase [Planctomycetes bacterium]|nr:alpha/beta fold hydrolase [Planctomycetota bacterium]
MNSPTPLTLEIPGLTLQALAWGPEDGTPVLAVHGWLDNAASFEPIAAHLGGFRLVAIDLPGHGHSDHRPPGTPYHFVVWVVDVAAAADALGWEQFSLLGHSMGAGITSLLAGTIPGRIRRLALIEGLGPLACAHGDAPERLAIAIKRRASREKRGPRSHATLEAAVERLLQVNPALPHDAAKLIVTRGTRDAEGGGVTWRTDPRLRGFSPMRITEEHVTAFLERIACPTLLIRGREGYPFDPRGIGIRIDQVRDMTVEEFPGGHHIHMEDPTRVGELLRSFLSGPAPPPWKGVASSPQRYGVTVTELAALKSVRMLILDVDGVLTPGARVHYGPNGNDQLEFSIRDGMGIKLLQRAGVEVALLSGRDAPAVRARARDLGIEHLMLGVEQKVPRLRAFAEEQGLSLSQIAYMGDDLNDIPVLGVVGFGAAPRDAQPEVRRACHWVAGASGGRGAVRELAELIIKFQGKWEEALAYYQR